MNELGRSLFSTRSAKMSPYNLEHFVREPAYRTGDYVVLAHSVHGVNAPGMKNRLAIQSRVS
jgi:hypothetical protein